MRIAANEKTEPKIFWVKHANENANIWYMSNQCIVITKYTYACAHS